MQKSPAFRTKSLGIFFLFLIVVFTFIGVRTFRMNTTNKEASVFTQSEKITAGSAQYKRYTIQIAAGWAVTHTNSHDTLDNLTITKNNYKVEIYQKKKPEYLNCNVIFAQEKNVLGATSHGSYVDFNGTKGYTFRRSIIPPNPNAQKTSNSICQKTEQGFTLPTQFGVIEYETPIDADSVIMKEMDAMIQSLQ